MVEKITSKENGHIKKICALLASSRTRQAEKAFAIEGKRLCVDAAISGISLQTLFVTEAFVNKNGDAFQMLCTHASQVYAVPETLMQRITDTKTPQGVAAICAERQSAPWTPRKKGRYVVLERIQDPANLGAILRTAEAFGVDGAILCADCCELYNPKALRAGMGAMFRVNVLSQPDGKSAVRFFADAGVRSFAAALSEQAKMIGQCDFSAGGAVFIGNEGNGLTEETIACCDETVMIPQRGKANSLNAAVAAGILLYELTKEL